MVTRPLPEQELSTSGAAAQSSQPPILGKGELSALSPPTAVPPDTPGVDGGRKEPWKDREARLRAVESPYLLGSGAPALRPLGAPGRVWALLLGSAGLRGGGDALDGGHWPEQPQQPLGGVLGDGTPQGNSFGASPRI